MLIDFHKILEYGVTPKGVIHVGMHKAEEWPIYIATGVKAVVFFEANRKLYEEAWNTWAKDLGYWEPDAPSLRIYHAAISDKKEKIIFNITNNGESSSILELGDHATIYPGIVNVESVEMNTSTLDEFIPRIKSDAHFNILNFDIQGAELKAMKGLTDWSGIEAVFTEVNFREMYKGCALVHEIDEFLTDKGFAKVEQVDTGAGWGDALYVRAYV